MKEVKFLLLCVAWNVSVLLCFKVASLNLNVLFCFALPCKQVSAGCRDECGGTMCRQSDSTKGRYLCSTWHPELKSLCCKLQIFVTSKNVHAWLRRRSCFVLMIKMQQSPFELDLNDDAYEACDTHWRVNRAKKTSDVLSDEEHSSHSYMELKCH